MKVENALWLSLILAVAVICAQAARHANATLTPEPKAGSVYATYYDNREDLYALTNGFGEQFGTQYVVVTYILGVTNGTAYATHATVNIDELPKRPIMFGGNQWGPAENFKTYHGTHYNHLKPQ